MKYAAEALIVLSVVVSIATCDMVKNKQESDCIKDTYSTCMSTHETSSPECAATTQDICKWLN